MATDVNKNVSDIKTAQDKLVDSRGKLSRFSYTEEAYVNNEAFGVASYNYANEQNVPLGTTEAMETNASVVNKGFREQASSVARQLMNHFFGRTSFNLNKINDYFNSLLVQFLRHLSQDDNAYSATAVYVPDDICFVLDASHNKRTFRYVGTVAESGHAPLNNDGTINTNYWAEINVSTVNGKTGKVTLYGTDVAIASNNASTVGSALSGITGNPNSANGTVKLDSNGRVPYDQLPESTMNYMGDWNAKTNTPTLKNGTGVKGEFYLVTVAGTWNGIEFTVNDRIIYNGTEWRKMEGGSVNSVNNQSPTNGNVTLTGDNINTSVTLQDKTTQTQTVQTAINNKQSTPVEITQANYNKLTSTQRQKNLYIITDAPETEDTYINDNVTANDTAWSSNKVVSHVNGALTDLKLTDFSPDNYSTDNEFYKALVNRAFEIGGYNCVAGVIVWNNHWYGLVRVFSTSATSGTIEVINHSEQKELLVKVSGDSVNIQTVALKSDLTDFTNKIIHKSMVFEKTSTDDAYDFTFSELDPSKYYAMFASLVYPSQSSVKIYVVGMEQTQENTNYCRVHFGGTTSYTGLIRINIFAYEV